MKKFLCLALFSTLTTWGAGNPVLPVGGTWRYTLFEGSMISDNCLICGRPSFFFPVRGTFDWLHEDDNTLNSRYILTNINFTYFDPNSGPTQQGETKHITGNGTYEIGGEIAIRETMILNLVISSSSTNEPVTLTNTSGGIIANWPMINASLQQDTESFVHVYDMQLNAAPFRELWFSTTGNLTSATLPAGSNTVSNGDILSTSGRIVKRSTDLTAGLGIQPVVPPLAMDAFDVLPGGEIAFSLNDDAFSERLGTLKNGDELGSSGRIIKRNNELLAAFTPGGADGKFDVGLDTLQVTAAGETLFSIRSNVFSGTLNTNLSRGDILSDKGVVVKTTKELLNAFSPIAPAGDTVDAGLDGFYIWPSGETWFTTEDSFNSGTIGTVSSGDLLSDRGYVVFRNLELVSKFQPIEDVNSFGLDGIFVVSDAVTSGPGAAFSEPHLTAETGNLSLQWTGGGRVFQAEKATSVVGPYEPVSAISPDNNWIDQITGLAGFYRLRQW